jgi:hypothetical protein
MLASPFQDTIKYVLPNLEFQLYDSDRLQRQRCEAVLLCLR